MKNRFAVYGSYIDNIVEPELEDGVSLYEFAEDMNMIIATPKYTREMGSRIIGFQVYCPLPTPTQLKGLKRIFKETFKVSPKVILTKGDL